MMHRGAAKKYDFTPQLDEALRRIYAEHGGRHKVIAPSIQDLMRRTGWPRHAFYNRAQILGCAVAKRPWKQHEITFLAEHMGSRSASWISRQLKRSQASVIMKAGRLGLYLRVLDGYSLKDLADVFGVHEMTVKRWIRSGWITPSQETGRIPEQSVGKFIRQHATEYSLKNVDEAWFKGMIFPRAEILPLKELRDHSGPSDLPRYSLGVSA